MLDEVSVAGYKSLRDVSLELGRLNVFVGANGAGKTNLLEAIGLLGCAASGRVDDGGLMERGVRPGLPALYRTALSGSGGPGAIRLECRSGSATYRLQLNNPIDDPAQAWRVLNEKANDGDLTLGSHGPGRSYILNGEHTKLPITHDGFATVAPLVAGAFPESSTATLINALDNFGIYTPFTPMLRGTTPDTTQRQPRPMGLMGGRLAEAVQETMRTESGNTRLKAVYRLIDWVKGFQVGSAKDANLSPSVASTRTVLRFKDRHMTERRNQVSAFDASEGALYVMFLLTLVAHPTSPPIAAVDNVDQALNPRLARELVKAAQAIILEDDHAPQLLITGHNPQLLDGLDLRDDRVRLFAVDRTNQGATTIKRIAIDDALHAKMKADGRPLSQLWTEGWLGGMPNL